jgi:CTP:molybdopterin cytidylyltransferase MocA
MFSSVLCAARWDQWKPEVTHWAIVLGDQPHLRTETLNALLEFAADHADYTCQPTYSGRPRHPVILPRGVFQDLKDSKAEHLKHFLQSRGEKVCLCHLPDPGLDFDLDEPSDYEQALRQFGEDTSSAVSRPDALD